MAAPTIVFDLDDTLVDTAPDLIDTLNVIFAQEGFAPLAYEEARNFVGGGARLMIARGFNAQGRVLSPNKLEQLFKDFIAHYSEHLTDRSLPFPGVADTLDVLAARGCNFAVCTNKLEALSVRLLGKLELSDRFVAICGQETFGMRKPDPEILRRTIGAAGGRLETAVMIGDSVTDIRTAPRQASRLSPSILAIASGPLWSSVRTGLSVVSPSCRRQLPQFRLGSNAGTEI